jgi:XRE family aerobic/anaerobic benzoate catabolism transcriptional regulator
MDDLVSILKSREPLYAKADRIIDTEGKKPEQSLRELSSMIDFPKPATERRIA